MTPGILNLQEIKNDFNLKMLNCSMRFFMFRKFEKIIIRWITPSSFRTNAPRSIEKWLLREPIVLFENHPQRYETRFKIEIRLDSPISVYFSP